MSIQKVVDALNAAFAADPGAMRALMINRVPCNMALANDPYVVVAEDRNLAGDHFSVGMLGVINGVLAAAGMPIVAAKWDMREDGPNVFAGFMAYITLESVCVADQSPQPDQYWQHKKSDDRVYFIGRTPDGEMVWQCEGDLVEVGNLDWSEWEYLPGCDSWEWKPVAVAVEEFPQYWTKLDIAGYSVAYVERIGSDAYYVVYDDGSKSLILHWGDSDKEGRRQITKAQAEALEIRRPKPVVEATVIQHPAFYVNPYWSESIGYIVRLSATEAKSVDRITGEQFDYDWNSFNDESVSKGVMQKVTEAAAKSRINPPAAVKAPSDIMGQSPDDWVPMDEKYDDCQLLPGYQFRNVAYANEWKTIDSRDTLCGLLIKDERKDDLGEWEFRCMRADLPIVNARIPVALYWYDGAIVGRYADSPVTDPSFVPIHSDSNGGWFIERSDNAGN